MSKTLLGFAGTVLGGAIAGFPFDTGAANTVGIVMCPLSKMALNCRTCSHLLNVC